LLLVVTLLPIDFRLELARGHLRHIVVHLGLELLCELSAGLVTIGKFDGRGLRVARHAVLDGLAHGKGAVEDGLDHLANDVLVVADCRGDDMLRAGDRANTPVGLPLIRYGSDDIDSALSDKLLERIGARGASSLVDHINTPDGENSLDDLLGFIAIVREGLGVVAIGRAVGAGGYNTVYETR